MTGHTVPPHPPNYISNGTVLPRAVNGPLITWLPKEHNPTIKIKIQALTPHFGPLIDNQVWSWSSRAHTHVHRVTCKDNLFYFI